MTNEKNKNGKMTLDKLAGMVARGFDKTSADLIEVKDKLSEHDRRFSKLEFQVDEIHEILDRFEENDVLDLQKRIKILERTVKAIAQHLNK